MKFNSLPVQPNCTVFCNSLSIADRPVVTCHPPAAVISAALEERTARVEWDEPSYDKSGNFRLVQVSPVGQSSGDLFAAGTHQVVYYLEDTAGNMDSCSFQFQVTVAECLWPALPEGVTLSCPSSLQGSAVWGEVCYTDCAEGYTTTEGATARERTCQQNGNFSGNGFNICQGSHCTAPVLPENSVLEGCSNNYAWHSVCTVSCVAGYKLGPGSGSTLLCGGGNVAGWNGMVNCVAEEANLVISDCPASITLYVDSNQQATLPVWVEPTVNNPNVQVVLAYGPGPGSEVTYNRADLAENVQRVVYTAGDANEAEPCMFTVTVTELTCPPIEPTQYLQISCSDPTTYGARCSLSCESSHILRGSDEVYCDVNSGSTSAFWNWGEMGLAYCQVKVVCQNLHQPENGALNCVQISTGLYCTLECDPGYDWARSVAVGGEWVCDDGGGWQGAGQYVPDCTEKLMSENIELENVLYYGSPDCSTPTTQALLTAVSQILNTQSAFTAACTDPTKCSVRDIAVTSCTESSGNGKKRSLTHDIQISFTLDIAIQYPAVVDVHALYTSLENQLYAMSQAVGTEVSNGDFAVSGYELDVSRYDAALNGVFLVCGSGMTPSYSTFTCRMCPRGTMYNETLDDCELCPVGHYQDQDHRTSCTQCPEGMSTKAVGATDVSFCTDLCPAGQYSPDGMLPCYSCPVRTYQPDAGQTGCVTCPGETGDTTTGMTDRQQCLNEPCDSTLCGEHGICLPTSPPTCLCYHGHTGATCSVAPSPSASGECNHNPCLNGGVCQADSLRELGFGCQCGDQYSGKYCEMYIAPGMWSGWSSCDVTCGVGSQSRQRVTNTGRQTEDKRCHLDNCKECPELSVKEGSLICDNEEQKHEESCQLQCSNPGYIPTVNAGRFVCSAYTGYQWTPSAEDQICTKSSVPEKIQLTLTIAFPTYQQTNSVDPLIGYLESVNSQLGLFINSYNCINESVCDVEAYIGEDDSTAVVTVVVEMYISLPSYFLGGVYDPHSAKTILTQYLESIQILEDILLSAEMVVKQSILTDQVQNRHSAEGNTYTSSLVCPEGMVQVNLLCAKTILTQYLESIQILEDILLSAEMVVKQSILTDQDQNRHSAEGNTYTSSLVCPEGMVQVNLLCGNTIMNATVDPNQTKGNKKTVYYIVAGVLAVSLIAFIAAGLVLCRRRCNRKEATKNQTPDTIRDIYLHTPKNIRDSYLQTGMVAKREPGCNDDFGYETPVNVLISPEHLNVYEEIPEGRMNKHPYPETLPVEGVVKTSV